MKVEVYSKSTCPFCTQAKLYLNRHNISFSEYILDDDVVRQAFYKRVGDNVKTVPQIFVDGVKIGGYHDLIKSDIVAQHEVGNFTVEF